MSWSVEYTVTALYDLEAAYEYIAFVLFSPETAENQVNRIRKAVSSLDYMPEKHKIYDEEPRKSDGVRYFPVDNYLVFYRVVKEKNLVNIIRIIYGGRDISQQLSKSV